MISELSYGDFAGKNAMPLTSEDNPSPIYVAYLSRHCSSVVSFLTTMSWDYHLIYFQYYIPKVPYAEFICSEVI